MPSNAAPSAARAASLDSLYGLIRPDLARVDALILARVQSEVPLIGIIAQHIIASGGKRIRPAMTLIAAQLCGHAGGNAVPLAAAIEFIHTATLLHDDVVDESKLRRGLATANEIHGNKASVLVGDFLLSQAFQLMVEEGSLKVLKILSEASAIIAKGEVMQLMAEGNPDTGREHYLSVVSAKTAALFASACELGAVAAATPQHEEKLRRFGMHIGIAFQLVDDVLDYHANESELGKKLGDDFREGKMTLPTIIAYAAGDANEQAFWQRTMGERNQREGDLTTAIGLLKRHGAIDKAIEEAENYCNLARAELSGFAPGPAKSALLEMVDFCAARVF